MDVQLNDTERRVLRLMIQNMYSIIDACGGYLDIKDSDGFSSNDFFNLLTKFGIEELYL